MRTLPVIASIVTAAALAVPAAAQSLDDAPRPVPAQARAKRGQKTQKKLNITQALRSVGVDDARIRQVVTIHQKYASQHQRVRAGGKHHHEALRSLIEKGSQDEAAYQRALDGLEKEKGEHLRLRSAERQEVRKVLKPSEQAKLLAKRQRSGPRASGNPRGPHAGKPTDGPHARADSY